MKSFVMISVALLSLMSISLGAHAQLYATCGTAWNMPYISDDTWSQSTLGVASDNATSGAPSCGLTLGTAGQRWYRFTWEGCTSQITWDTSDPATNFDTQIHVYTGSCGSLTCVASDDDSGMGLTSLVTFTVEQNVSYLVRVGGYQANAGNFVVKVTVGIGGCMDPDACNYNPSASWNDCSCVFNEGVFTLSGTPEMSPGSYVYLYNGNDVIGYLFPGESISFCAQDLCYLKATFYLGWQTTSWSGITYTLNMHGQTWTGAAGNGSNYYTNISFDSPECGCMDPTAMNYDPQATENDFSCEQNVPGSMCENAVFMSVPSYLLVDLSNENATFDTGNGSMNKSKWAEFVFPGGVLNIELAAEGWWGDPFMRIYDECGDPVLVQSDDYYVPYSVGSLNSRLSLSCVDGLVKGENYFIQATDLTNSGNVIIDIRLEHFPGCTDPLASNYSACASVDDGSCDTCPADLDNSGVVNVTDLLQFVSAYGTSCN